MKKLTQEELEERDVRPFAFSTFRTPHRQYQKTSEPEDLDGWPDEGELGFLDRIVHSRGSPSPDDRYAVD